MQYSEYQQFKDQPPQPLESAVEGKLKPTPSDIEGPFYKEGAPIKMDISQGRSGAFYLEGNIWDINGNVVTQKVTMDFWQASPEGQYDNNGFMFRGKQVCVTNTLAGVHTNNPYLLKTVRPGNYKISATESRCSHIHVKVSAPGFKPLTTQLYFPDDPLNKEDNWFKSELVMMRESSVNEAERLRFDFVLAPE